MKVNNFKVGDGIILYGWEGVVTEVSKLEKPNGHKCTYLKVSFNKPDEVGYQYDGGWYGGLDDVVAYGYYKR